MRNKNRDNEILPNAKLELLDLPDKFCEKSYLQEGKYLEILADLWIAKNTFVNFFDKDIVIEYLK